MTAIKATILALAIVLGATEAHATGACWPIFGESAGNAGIAFDANTTMTGTLGAHTMPLMTDASDGGFYAFTVVSKLCAAGGEVTFQPNFINLDGTAVDDLNVCMGAAVAVLTVDASGVAADWTPFSSPVVASTDTVTCDGTDASSVCIGTTTAAIAMLDLGTGLDCASTDCVGKRAIVYVYRDTGASCTDASTVDVTFTDGWLCCD